MTYREIGEYFHLSRSQARNVVKKAIGKKIYPEIYKSYQREKRSEIFLNQLQIEIKKLSNIKDRKERS